MRTQLVSLWIAVPTFILITLSLIVLHSVIPRESGPHLAFIISGIVAFLLVSRIDYRVFGELSRFLYGLAIFLLFVTYIFGGATRGSVRWIEFGPVSIQPSELVKPAMIIFLAHFASRNDLRQRKNFLIFSLLTAIPVVFVYAQPDLGSSLVLAFIGASIAFTGGTPLWVFAAALGALAASMPVIYRLLKAYQQDRLRAFIDPFADPLGSGYHIIQSMIAVGSGMVFGRGLGHGTQSQLRFLPERHSDFVFASLAEELGFLGALLTLVSYGILIFFLLRSIREGADAFGNYILIGVSSMLLFQVAVNIGMNLGLLPITGITLPLVSLGGSSMFSTMVSLGVAQSIVSRNAKHQTIEIR